MSEMTSDTRPAAEGEMGFFSLWRPSGDRGLLLFEEDFFRSQISCFSTHFTYEFDYHLARAVDAYMWRVGTDCDPS